MKNKYSAIALLTLVLIAIPAETSSAPPGERASAPVVLTWENITQEASRTWERYEGAARDELLRGVASQRAALPGRLLSAQAMLTSQVPLPSENRRVAEHGVMGGVTVTLGDLPEKMAHALDDQEALTLASARRERWEFIARVHSAYRAWFEAATLEAHLVEDIAAARDALAPLEAATTAGQLGQLELLDLKVEIAEMTTEHNELSARERGARAELERLLGHREWRLPDAPLHASGELAGDNPWEQLSATIERHPVLAQLRAEARSLDSRAEVLRSSQPWQLQVGAALETAGWREAWVTWQVGVSVPLSNPNLIEASELEASANAREIEVERALELLTAELSARAADFDRRRAALERLDRELITVLERRQSLLEAALEKKATPLERVLRARRQLHEAKHQRLELWLSLRASEAAAALAGQWFNASTEETR